MQPDQRLYRGTRIPAAIEGLAVEGCRQSGEAPHGGVDAALPPCSRTLLFRKRFSLTMHTVECGYNWVRRVPVRVRARALEGERTRAPRVLGRWRRFNVARSDVVPYRPSATWIAAAVPDISPV